MAEDVGGGELRGGYAEDTQVAGNLDQADFNDLMTRQLVQYAVTAQQQLHQAALEDQRRMSNAVQLMTVALLNKGVISHPKALSENVVSESVSKTVNDDSSLTASQVTLDDFSKVVDSFASAIKDIESQMTDVLAALARVEVEGE